MADSIRTLARRIKRIERILKAATTTPQLAYSSLENGSILEHDIEGNLVGIYGQQHDGTHVAASVGGPPPPEPTTPTVSAGFSQLVVNWDGTFINGANVPMDFGRVEIHISTADGFLPDLAEGTLRTTFESPRGGRVVVPVPYGQTYFVRLLARSFSGKASDPSGQASGAAKQIETIDVADAALIITKFKTLNHHIF